MSHRHHTSHIVIGLELGALATQFPRTAGFIVLALFGLGCIVATWLAWLVIWGNI